MEDIKKFLERIEINIKKNKETLYEIDMSIDELKHDIDDLIEKMNENEDKIYLNK